MTSEVCGGTKRTLHLCYETCRMCMACNWKKEGNVDKSTSVPTVRYITTVKTVSVQNNRMSEVTDSKQAVIESAIKAFAQAGYAGTSVQAILSATGLSKPTLYYHFGSKEGLFVAILHSAHDGAFERMEKSVAGSATPDCGGKLRAIAVGLFLFATEKKDLMRLVLSSLYAAPQEIPSGSVDPARVNRNIEFVEKQIRAGQKSGELCNRWTSWELTQAFFGLISQPIRMNLLLGKGKLDEKLAGKLVELFLNGARS